MHNEAIRLNTDKTAGRALPLREPPGKKAPAVLHRNYPRVRSLLTLLASSARSYPPEEMLQNSFAFQVEANDARERTRLTIHRPRLSPTPPALLPHVVPYPRPPDDFAYYRSHS